MSTQLRQALRASLEQTEPRTIAHVIDRIAEPSPLQKRVIEMGERLRQQRITEGE